MNRKLIGHCVLIAGLLLICRPLLAHHGNSAYDTTHPITLSGTVTEFVWANPHCQIYMDVKDDKGNIVRWAVESNSPGILLRDGWTKESLKAGDAVTITFMPAKNGNPVGVAVGAYDECKVVLANGKELSLKSTQKQ
jgi:hypothetical protein